MSIRFGVNTWVWTAPLTTSELARLAPHVRGLGFDWIELPLETVSDVDPARARDVLEAHGLGASVCVAMGPDRDLIHPDPADKRHRHAVRARHDRGGRGPRFPPRGSFRLSSAVGRTWAQTADEREADIVRLIGQLRKLGITPRSAASCCAWSRSTGSRRAS